ncbi:MAG: MMPL family transporter [Rhodothermales bacterium]|nr:MMPL family transporter [Rhodothermales bacterium]
MTDHQGFAHKMFLTLEPVIRRVSRKPVLVLVCASVLAIAGAFGSSKLTIDTDFANLIPESYKSVQALEKLRASVGSESEAAIAIVSPSFEDNTRFADAVIDRIPDFVQENGEQFITRVDYRRDTAFLENNALYFATPEEIDRVETELTDRIEEAKLEANPFYFDLDEEDDDDEDSESEEEDLEAVYDRIVGKEYPISDDSTTLVLRLYPSGSQTNLGFITALYDGLDALVEEIDPVSYNPDMEIVIAGRLLRQKVEVEAIRSDIAGSFGVGILAVLFLVTFYFAYKSYTARVGWRFDARILVSEVARMPFMALLIGVPLIMSLCWTFGSTYLIVGSLNLMTSTLGLVLFGLGIDYGIHFYARYSEERAQGESVEDATATTFISTGQAITVGALTTALALYTLTIADFKGFSEFGFIAGTGILFAVIAMLVVMPALISILERIGILNLERIGSAQMTRPSGRIPAARGVVVVSMLLVVGAIVFFPPQFEYRFGELEPEYVSYNEKNDVIRRVHSNGSRRNPAYIVLDTSDEAEAVVAALRTKIESDTLSPTISTIENLQERFPMHAGAIQQRLDRLAEIREILSDPILTADESHDIERLRKASSTTEALQLDQVPKFLRDQFTSRDGSLGNFVIIYPSVGLSDGRMSIAFSEDVGTVTTSDGQEYYAGSTSLVAADMLKLMQREAPFMVLITFAVVALLMWINFGSIKWGMLALVPLVVGVLWMILLMELFDLRFNFYNLIVLPAILGIGNDAGVHLVHRYREEGRGSITRVLRSTGEHIAMGSFTTTIGFAGPLLSFHPGLNSIGSLAVVGIMMTLLSTLVFLPALIQSLEQSGRNLLLARDSLSSGVS